MTDLITSGYAKDYLGIKTNEDDSVIAYLVTAATEAIENTCDRTFASATYNQWIDGTGSNYILLPQYPITALTRISLDKKVALEVTCTKSGASRAYISVSSTALTLNSVTQGTTTTNSLTLASYATLTLLKAAIDAVSGWSATIMNSDANWSPSDIRPCQGWECYTPAQVGLYVPSDAETELDYNTDRMVYLSSVAPKGNKNIFVSWTGGYTTIPQIIQVCCAKLVGELYHEGKRDGSLQSETIGAYSWSAKADNMLRTTGMIKDLMPYIKL